MSDQDSQDRTERASSRRREKAREEGQVAKSMDLNAAAVLGLGFLAIYMMGPYMAHNIMELMRHTMTHAPQIVFSDPTFLKIFVDSLVKFFLLLGPLFGILLVVAFAVNIAQVGFKITPKALEPKFDKLDLIKGAKKIVSMKSLVQLIKDTLKLTVIGIAAYKTIESDFDTFFLLPDMSIFQFASVMGKLTLGLALKMSGVIFVIAALDYAYQKFEFEKSIRMSKQDLKDEHKDTEGSPQLKARIRQVQRDTARSRMMDSVPMADVVVTNPTHIAVALKYDTEKSEAPFVLAKGERKIAQKIKLIAKEHGVPVIEDKPLARALFKICDIGDIVPQNLFKAVAEILAHVYKLKGKKVN